MAGASIEQLSRASFGSSSSSAIPLCSSRGSGNGEVASSSRCCVVRSSNGGATVSVRSREIVACGARAEALSVLKGGRGSNASARGRGRGMGKNWHAIWRVDGGSEAGAGTGVATLAALGTVAPVFDDSVLDEQDYIKAGGEELELVQLQASKSLEQGKIAEKVHVVTHVV